MAEAYCVKDKKKVEVQNAQKITMKNGKPATPGHVPDLRRQGLPDRRLTLTFDLTEQHRTPADGGGRSMSGPSAPGPERRPDRGPATGPLVRWPRRSIRVDPRTSWQPVAIRRPL